MGRLFLVECDKNPLVNYIHCCMCRTRVAFREDRIFSLPNWTVGIYHKVFNVQVLDDEKYLELNNGYTLADAYCVGCGMLLGWKLIGVPEPVLYVREGRFLMKLDKLIYWNNNDQLDDEQGEGANEQVPNDQDGGAVEQVPNDQDGGAIEQVNDQDGGAIEQVPNDQDGDANEQVPNDQDGAANEQVPNDQDGGAIEQVPNDQDGGANEQVPNDQDGGAIEQVPNDQDGGASEQVPNDQDGGAIEQVPNQDVDQLADGMNNIGLNSVI